MEQALMDKITALRAQLHACAEKTRAGEDHPQIHTEHYEYPDALLGPTARAFWALLTE